VGSVDEDKAVARLAPRDELPLGAPLPYRLLSNAPLLRRLAVDCACCRLSRRRRLVDPHLPLCDASINGLRVYGCEALRRFGVSARSKGVAKTAPLHRGLVGSWAQALGVIGRRRRPRQSRPPSPILSNGA
jgi:hypothetical protein